MTRTHIASVAQLVERPPCERDVAQGNLMGVPVFIKQLGSQPMAYAVTTPGQVGLTGTEESITIKPFVDRAGADPEQWPEHLRVQELPQ